MQPVLGLVAPVVVTQPLTEPGRLVGQADAPLAQAGEPEVSWYCCSPGECQAVLVVVGGGWRFRALAKPGVMWRR